MLAASCAVAAESRSRGQCPTPDISTRSACEKRHRWRTVADGQAGRRSRSPETNRIAACHRDRPSAGAPGRAKGCLPPEQRPTSNYTTRDLSARSTRRSPTALGVEDPDAAESHFTRVHPAAELERGFAIWGEHVGGKAVPRPGCTVVPVPVSVSARPTQLARRHYAQHRSGNTRDCRGNVHAPKVVPQGTRGENAGLGRGDTRPRGVLMSPSSDRREFLKVMFREAAREAIKINDSISSSGSLAGATRPQASEAGDVQPLPRASPAKRCCSPAELLSMAQRCGLQARLGDVAELARLSVRLTPRDSADGWCERSEVRAQLDLKQIAAQAGRSTGLPDVGVLRFRGKDPGPEATGVTPCEVEHVGTRTRAALPSFTTGGRVTPTAEVTLPRMWSASVDALALDDDERLGWHSLREALARAQGVDPIDSTSGTHRIDRLLGYPDETTGLMPETCEFHVRALDADVMESLELEQFREHSSRWRLLLQAQADPRRSVHRRRWYFWIDAEALADCEFRNVVAIVR